MSQETLTRMAEAQQVLDELWAEKQLPFKLSVGKITLKDDVYTLDFYDSRFRTVRVPLTRNETFRETVRNSVLARVLEMSIPPDRKRGQ